MRVLCFLEVGIDSYFQICTEWMKYCGDDCKVCLKMPDCFKVSTCGIVIFTILDICFYFRYGRNFSINS